MAWDLATAKARLGILPTDTSKDIEIQLALDTALAIAEKYCDRFFLQQTETEVFYRTHSNTFQLSRYPLVSITSVTGASGGSAELKTGILSFPSHVSTGELTVVYEGGYVVLPADLEMALWGVFDSAYASLSSSGGGGAVSGGVKKLMITGVGSVDYDTSGGGATISGDFGGLIPAMARAILDLYKKESV